MVLGDGMTNSVDPSRVTFLVAGCERCGTTWIDAALRSHADVFLPAEKQSYFFDRNHEQGADWYLERFADAGSARAVGEVATGYCLPDAVPRMAALLPHVRLIMSMRNPIDRAYSNYMSRREQMGWSSMDDAIERSPEMLERGHYAEQIEAILAHYDRSQLALVFFDDLESDDRGFLRGILEHIGVDADVDSPMIGQAKNSAMFPRVRRVMHRAGLKPLLVATSRSSLGDSIRRVRRRMKLPAYAPLDPGVRERLHEHFRPWNERLEKLAGRDLGHWT